jgi:tetratricopeptide (TPR) repeat protein
MARSTAFVGREERLGELRASWHAAVGGRGGLVVVSGEAGIGKTRLVEQLAAEVSADGAATSGGGDGGHVAWGTCAGLEAPPLWPWRAVLRELPGGADAAAGLGTPAAFDLVDPAGDQARTFARIVEQLRRAAADEPLLVVLDDLHWADPDSLGLLRLAVSAVRRAPLLLVGTLRPDEVEAAPAVRATLSDLASSTEVVHLGGLGVDAVGCLVGELTGSEPTNELAEALARQTGGNPFFVRELLRLLVAEGGLDTALAGGRLTVPPLVRDVLLRRVAQLSAPARALLDVAAVAGSRAPLPVLAEVLGQDLAAVQGAADEAEAARFVSVAAQELRFAHDLVREAVVAELDAGERRRLHLATGRVLRDAGGPGAPSAQIAEIAGHLVDALPAGDPVEAASAALAAGQQALGLHAPTDGIHHLERGLAALGGSGPSAAPVRTSVLLTLGDARTVAGDRSGAREAYKAAAVGARTAGDAEGLARAALGFAGWMGTVRPDPERVALLEEALATVADRRDALVARLKARLAHALLFSDQRSRRPALADEAVALARETGDDETLAAALYAWSIVHVAVGNYSQRLAVADELLALGRSCGVEEVEASALHFHAHLMAEGGDFAAFDADVGACEAVARRIHNATWQWTSLVHRAMRATMQGRFSDAETLGDRAFELGAKSQHEVAAATYYAHLVALRTWQGRLDELLPMIAAGAGQHPELPAAWAAVPYAHAEMGRKDEATEALRRAVATHELEDIPGAQSWAVALAMLARAAAVTGDAEVAGRVRMLLDPLVDRHIVGPFADCYFGPASLSLGLCSATVGDLAEASVQLERAVRQATSVGARPAAAWAKAELARVLERQGGDAGRVAALRGDAVAELSRLGTPRHLDALDDQPAPAPAMPPTPVPERPNEFHRTAEGWSITYDGRAVVVRHTKGLADIHRLLAAAGAELHVLELAREAEGDGTAAAPPPAGGGSRQPVLDERAKAAYRQRVRDLEAEAEDARACADIARAERAEAELDFVVAELAAGLGFGGRDRTMTDETERARQAVRARIRYTLDRLERVHPALRRHLDRALVTGTFCSYQPERPTAWVT